MSHQRGPELRHIVVIRHAKSSWDDPSIADHDRPLSKRGRNALSRLRDHIEGLELRPELVMCSSSLRTRETLAGIRAAFGRKARVEFEARRCTQRAPSSWSPNYDASTIRSPPWSSSDTTPGLPTWWISRRRSGNRQGCDRQVPDRRGRGPVGGRALERAATGMCHARKLLGAATAELIDASGMDITTMRARVDKCGRAPRHSEARRPSSCRAVLLRPQRRGGLLGGRDAKPKSTVALRRLDNIRAVPWVAMLVDHYADDWAALWWIRIDGTARVIDTGPEFDHALRLLVGKYEQYLRNAPPGPVIAIDVTGWRAWP